LGLLWSPVWARVGVRWTSVALAGGPSAGIVSHRCSLSMCTCAVAALVEGVRVGRSVPGTRYRLDRSWLPVWARAVPVWACVVPAWPMLFAARLLGCIAAVCL